MGHNDDISLLKGQFLIAMPGLADPNFSQTVTCISEHTSEGAVGIIVNRVHSSLSGKIIFEELKIDYTSAAESMKIYLGGPVHIGEIFVLHGPPFGCESCFMVSPSLALSNSKDIVEAIAMARGPESFILALGCAGWGPDQLESEIKQNAWLTCPVSDEIIFDIPVDTRWNEAVRRMGIDPSLLTDTVGNA